MGKGYFIYKVGVCKYFFKGGRGGLNFVVLW